MLVNTQKIEVQPPCLPFNREPKKKKKKKKKNIKPKSRRLDEWSIQRRQRQNGEEDEKGEKRQRGT
jgi:hypothetical protein